MKTLGIRQQAILHEAVRRLETFHKGENPLEAWTGLGMPSEYKTVVNAGLMEPTSQEYPKCAQWYVLTKKGLDAIERLGILPNMGEKHEKTHYFCICTLCQSIHISRN